MYNPAPVQAAVPTYQASYNHAPATAPVQSTVTSDIPAYQAYDAVQTTSAPVHSVVYNPTPAAPVQTVLPTREVTYVQEPVYVQYVRAPTYIARSGPSNVVDDVNRFLLQSSARPHVVELEKFAGGRRSSKASSRSDLECAFGRALRGNIFEPKFIF